MKTLLKLEQLWRAYVPQLRPTLRLAALCGTILCLQPVPVRAQILYGISISAKTLMTIDTQTGTATTIGSLGVNSMEGLAYDSDTDRLLGVSYDNYLYNINRTTGAATRIGLLGGGAQLVQFPGLEYDSVSHTIFLTTSPFYAAGKYTSSLYRVNPSTGAATKVANLPGNTIVDGLAYNPNTHVMYGVSSATYKIYTINTATAALTKIGNVGVSLIYTEAAYNAASDTLYWTDAGRGGLYCRNMTTGAGGLIGGSGLYEVRGLTFVPEPTSVLLLMAGFTAFYLRRSGTRPSTTCRTNQMQ
jgi:sugar lactone lactonase YvrE